MIAVSNTAYGLSHQARANRYLRKKTVGRSLRLIEMYNLANLDMRGYTTKDMTVIRLLYNSVDLSVFKGIRQQPVKAGKDSMLDYDIDVNFVNTFNRYVELWRSERKSWCDVSQMVMNPAYQRIIGMGKRVLPLIFRELERKPDHWFWALYVLTGADPVPKDSQGKLKEMAKIWIDWGKEQGYRW